MRLLNLTLFMHNAAQGSGATIQRSRNSSVDYTLLAPPGRWLYVPVGITFQLELQALEANFTNETNHAGASPMAREDETPEHVAPDAAAAHDGPEAGQRTTVPTNGGARYVSALARMPHIGGLTYLQQPYTQPPAGPCTGPGRHIG